MTAMSKLVFGLCLVLAVVTACPTPRKPQSCMASCPHAPARAACDHIPAIAIADLPARASQLEGKRVRITGPLQSVLSWCHEACCPRSDLLAIEQVGPSRLLVYLDELYCVRTVDDRVCCPLEPDGHLVSAVGELRRIESDRWWWSLRGAALCNEDVAP
jgi:hypothetical protein